MNSMVSIVVRMIFPLKLLNSFSLIVYSVKWTFCIGLIRIGPVQFGLSWSGSNCKSHSFEINAEQEQ